MSTTLTIRKAEPADLDTVDSLREEAVAWLASKGLDQWQPGQARVPTRTTTADSIARGTCYLAYDRDGNLTGTIAIDDHADCEFWTPAEQAEPALYVHRMIVPSAARGKEVGQVLLDWAAEFATNTGKRWLRLDAWKTNSGLHRYYLARGFRHVRTVDLAHRGSGALFQRRLPTDT
jgi:GNAT superfamily N-acetyltransferase